MRIKIYKGTAAGTMIAPPSKSMAHRLLICGAMTEKSSVSGIEFSEDICATIDCLKALGAKIEIIGDRVEVGGLNPAKFPENAELFCRESGSTLRFFIPLCLLSGKEIKLFGSERLLSRPQEVYEELCREKGFSFINDGKKITLKGSLGAGEYLVRGDVSSQFITGLIFALSLCGGGKIKLKGKTESGSYIELTKKALAEFGIDITLGENEIIVPAGAVFQNRDIAVEGDYSNAAFFDALNVFGGEVELLGLDECSLQGDRVYSEIFAEDTPEYDLSDCPDLAPIAFAVAAYKGGGHFSGTHRLKIKESDRAEAMRKELEKFGIKLTIGENEVSVSGKLTPPTTVLAGHNDHRIVMALAVLSTLTGGVIEGAEAAAKSLPDFFSRLASLGIKTEVETVEISSK